MNFEEIVRTAGAMRRLRPEPIDEELLRELIRSATCAPSPGNSQGWDFVVVTDEATRKALAALIEPAVSPLLPGPEVELPSSLRRMIGDARHLLANLAAVPAWVLVCGRPVYPASKPDPAWIASAVYPAAQNLVLAARAAGIGTVFTTYHKPCEAGVSALLGIPQEAEIAVTIPMGYPAEPFRRVHRKPVEEVLHWNGWGKRS